MAKLANVHFIGEGKVEYDGMIYVKHDGEAKAGDLAYVPSEFAAQMIKDVEEGGFYRLSRTRTFLEFVDELGDVRHFEANKGNLEIYRESTLSIVELEKRIAELERKLDGKSESKRLTVGGCAKVVANAGGHRSEIGDIVIIIEDERDQHPYKCETLDGTDVGWFYEKELVKATNEEVAEAKRKQAEVTKWAEIGREPNEFKKGDLVRVDNPSGASLPSGAIVEVVSDSDNVESVKIADVSGNSFSGYWLVSVSELICPVEHRFDRDDD